jgi:hypothetical protein
MDLKLVNGNFPSEKVERKIKKKEEEIQSVR